MSAKKRKYRERHTLVNAEKQKTHVFFEIRCFLLLKISIAWVREVKKSRSQAMYSLYANLHIDHKAQHAANFASIL